jgi:hypothetical protein
MKRAFPGALLAALCVLGSSYGDSPTYDVKVAAGAYDRKNVPVSISLPPVSLPDKPTAVILTDPDGKTFPAQLTEPGLLAPRECWRELHFILPHLKAGESLRFKATLSAESPPRGDAFSWRDKAGDFTELWLGTRPVVRYHYRAYDETSKESRDRTYKVFHHLFSPKGDVLTTGGLSDDSDVHSPHHRGIFFGFNRISYGNGKKADTWHCTNGAYQAHERFLASEAGAVLGRHRVVIGWHGQDRQAFANEERELTVYNVPGGQLVEFASRLKTVAGPVKLDGDPQHAGLHFRADNEVFAKTSGQTIFVRPDGVGKPGETRNWEPSTHKGPVNLPWNAMSFVLKSKRYTVAYLDHLTNPKEARFSEREYGRFGSYYEYTLEKDKSLRVNYRFWLQDGLMKPEEVAALSTDFIQPVEATATARQRTISKRGQDP